MSLLVTAAWNCTSMRTNTAQVSGTGTTVRFTPDCLLSSAKRERHARQASEGGGNLDSDSDSTLHGDLGSSSGFVDTSAVESSTNYTNRTNTSVAQFKLNSPCSNFPSSLSPSLYRTGDKPVSDEESNEFSDDSLAESSEKMERVTRRLEELAASWDNEGVPTLQMVDSIALDLNTYCSGSTQIKGVCVDSFKDPLLLLEEIKALKLEMKQLTCDLEDDFEDSEEEFTPVFADTDTDCFEAYIYPALPSVPELEEPPVPVIARLPSPKPNLAKLKPSLSLGIRETPASASPVGARSMWIPSMPFKSIPKPKTSSCSNIPKICQSSLLVKQSEAKSDSLGKKLNLKLLPDKAQGTQAWISFSGHLSAFDIRSVVLYPW